MRSKQGFTLVELLAVITILGILSLIAIPTVISIIRGTSEDILRSNEKLLSVAAENYYLMNTHLLPQEIGELEAITLEYLIILGYTKQIKNPNTLDNCLGYVVVEKITTKRYNYNAYLDCGTNLLTEGYYEYIYLIE